MLATIRPSTHLALSLLVCGALCAAEADDAFHLHMKITNRAYRDDRIDVRAPASWTIAIDHDVDGNSRGAVLRKGRYILRLCTACSQASGIAGGRFAEISGLVQPWFRIDPGANPGPCGASATTRISERLDRVDFWFRRDPAHSYDEEADDCRQPKTTATVWYGSYFTERPSRLPPGADCDGYFLHLGCLTNQPGRDNPPADEMAFGLTYDETDLDQLPRKGDPDLDRVLAEATAIVRSVRFKASK